MRIAVVSKADETAGGASRVAADLVRELAKAGHETAHFAAWTSKAGNPGIKQIYGRAILRKALLHAGKASRKLGFAETVPFEMASVLANLRSFDIVHFHDTSSAFSPYTLMAVAKRKKVAWTFHDCSPFTGGCIYPQMASCERYKVSCGSCPANGDWPIDGLFDMTRWALEARKRLHSDYRIDYVAPSEWMADTAFGSGHIGNRPTVISNMIDTDTFVDFRDRSALRRKLGLPTSNPIVALSAGNLSDPRKDIRSALGALRELAATGTRPTAILIGNPDPRIGAELDGIDFVATGYVSRRSELAQWLAASDAFITTSRADNQPLAIMEAMACGTPVYGWPVGGVSEMISEGINGRSFATMNPVDLARSLSGDYASHQLLGMRDTTRQWAVMRYGAASFVRRHEELYLSMIKRTGN